MNTQISITETGTTTLATAGKYCDRNIDVNVEVSSGILYDADKLVEGTISGDYVSDKVTNVKRYGFADCANLSSVSLPNCTSIGGAGFAWCTALESANLPNCVSFSGGSFFDNCTNLTTLNIPNLTTIENGARNFAGCKFEEFNAPNLTTLTGGTSSLFNGCTKLKKVNCPQLGGATLAVNMFNTCNRLVTVVLGGNQLNTLAGAFINTTPINNGTCYFYVPDDLVDTYKTATNWSAYASQIKPISELGE